MTSNRRPRRTKSALERDVHAAVLSAIAEKGYQSVTFEEVARRAHVSKPVLYRRYPDRPSMVVGAFAATVQASIAGDDGPPTISTPDTGSLREDLIQWFTDARERALGIGVSTYRGLVGEAEPAVLASISGLDERATDAMRTRIIDPAVARGELGRSEIGDATLLAPLRLLRDDLIFSGGSADVSEVVDHIALPLFRSASASDE